MRCLLTALTVLNLVYETTHAPSGVCPSPRYCKPCDEKSVVCTLSGLENITNYINVGQNYAYIDKLMINGCSYKEEINSNIKVRRLQLNCLKIGPYLSLFSTWEPHLKSISIADRTYTKNSKAGNKTCVQICSPNIVATRTNTSFCVCVSRTRNYGDNNNSTINTTLATRYLSNNESNGNSTTKKEVLEEKNKYHFHFLLAIGCVSMLALLVNFILLTSICSTQETKLIDVFGLALMVFNILLALYGVALAVYLSQNHAFWHERFCKGFTSIKLFALGVSVWTMMMLTFHRSVRGDIEDEREAIFKGIVYILEGLMLSGVLAVMSWIKLDKWDYLCVIFEPKTSVEWLLTGIEIMHYVFTFSLLLQYPYHQIRKRRNKSRQKTEGKKLNTNHPIFLMVLVCFVFWVSGYVITLPRFGMFTDKLRRVIRVCALILPLIFQPMIYLLRNTCCCLCRDPPCSKKKEETSPDHSVLLVCDCTGTETCPACETEYEDRYRNTQFYEAEANGAAQKKKNKKKKADKEKKEEKKLKKKRKNDVIEPKSIERSPVFKQRNISACDAIAETPLLEPDVDPQKEEDSKPTKKPKLTTDSTPLLDDTDGALKEPPKATPDSSPMKRKQDTEFPSFINMESAVDVDSLPKEKPMEKLLKLAPSNSVDEEGRKSRGPTFFPLSEKNSAEEKGKKKAKKKRDGEQNLKINNDSGVKRRKGKKKEVSENGSSKTTTKNNDRNSIVSLEWDHYSDSSGSNSRGSDYFPDEVVVVDNNTAQKNYAHQNNGISNKKSDKSDIQEKGDEELDLTCNSIKHNKSKQKADLLSQNTNGKVTSAS